MSTWFKSNYKHIWYNPNKKKSVSWKKYEKTIKSYKKLLKRTEIEGETKWIKNEMLKLQAKFKKYGITEEMLNA